MSDPTDKPRRHFPKYLPAPDSQQVENARRANLRQSRNKRIARKLDDVLGPIDAEE